MVTTAAVRCIREKFPQAEMHFITKDKYAEVIYKNPYINKIISYKKYTKEFKSELKTNAYDLIIDLHNNLRSRIISRGLGAKKIIRYNKDNLKKWFWVWFKIKPTYLLHTS